MSESLHGVSLIHMMQRLKTPLPNLNTEVLFNVLTETLLLDFQEMLGVSVSPPIFCTLITSYLRVPFDL